jgi:hypothetical protein
MFPDIDTDCTGTLKVNRENVNEIVKKANCLVNI